MGQGQSGLKGIDGIAGRDGKDGKDGISNIPGMSGKDGKDGNEGARGIRGPDGPEGKTGPLGPIGEVSKDFMKGNTLWCADGELCKIPNSKKGIDFGYGGSKISDFGNLTLETDDNIDIKIGGSTKLTAALNDKNFYLYGSRGLQFGQEFEKQTDAGQISYGRHDGEANGTLNIVGAGKDGQARVVRIWDTLRVGDAMLRQDDDWIRSIGDKNDPQSFDSGKGIAAKNLYAKNRVQAENVLTNNVQANKLIIGKWQFQQHPNGNLHIHRGDVNAWDAAIDNDGNFVAKGNIRSNQFNKWLF
jgi:hypothetical protein